MADENKTGEGTEGPTGTEGSTGENKTALTTPPPADTKTQEGGESKAGGEGKAQSANQPIEITLPEGVQADEKLLDAVKAAAKDSESAQALVDAWLGAQGAAKEQFEAILKEKEAKWAEELKADPEYGGAKYSETLATAQRAFQRFGGDELREYLETSREGNNPVLIKTFANIGRAIREDSISGTTDQGAEQSDEQKALEELFPEMAKHFANKD